MFNGLELALPLALVSASFFGVGKVLDKKGLSGTHLLMGVVYTLMVAPPLLLFSSIVNGELFVSHNYDFLAMTYSALAGISSSTIGLLLLYASIQIIGAARASVMVSTQVIFAPILSTVFLAETTSLGLAIGTIAIFVGLAFVSFSTPSKQNNMQINTTEFGKGYVYGLLGGFFWGTSYLFYRAAIVSVGSPTMASLLSYIFAILAVVLILLFSPSKRKFELKRASKIYLSCSGILRVLGTLSQSIALSLAPVVLVVPFVSLSPLVTVLASYLVIQKMELVNRNVLVGAVMVIIGAAVITAFK